MIFLAAAAQLENLPKLAFGNQPLNRRELRAVASLMRDGDAGMGHLARPHNVVRLGQRAAQGFLAEHMNAALDGRHHHLMVLIDEARTDRHDIGPSIVEQFTVIGIGLAHPEPRGGGGAAVGVGIGHAHELDLIGEAQPNLVEVVAIVSPARVTDDGNAMLVRQGWRSGAGDDWGEKNLERRRVRE
jgi:hypothetical protein